MLKTTPLHAFAPESPPHLSLQPVPSGPEERLQNVLPELVWQRANQHYLMAAVAEVRGFLERYRARDQAGAAAAPPRPAGEPWPAELPPSALERLCEVFGLSPFERNVLVLCAGMELDASFSGLCARAQGHAERSYPTFELALAALPGGHWSALGPASPLRRWQLVSLGNGATLTSMHLRISERILHDLAGVDYQDEELDGLVEPVTVREAQVPSHRELAERLAAAWRDGEDRLPVLLLCGSEAADQQAVAAGVCARLNLRLRRIPAEVLPPAAADLERVILLWRREAALRRCALLLDCHGVDTDDRAHNSAISRVVEKVSPLFLSDFERRRLPQGSLLVFEVDKPTTAEQRQLWRAALGEPVAGDLSDQVEHLVGQFRLSAPLIEAASAGALAWAAARGPGHAAELGKTLWNTCRGQLRPRLDELAQRVKPAARWSDLILPDAERRLIEELINEARWRVRVYESWGFASKGSRGQGVAALFAGTSGTGKTLAAEVIVGELDLDLYRVELATVVSKWIGETEKNLQKIFNAAEGAGAVLLFDEADALFGKRSDVKDSHDRFANIEVSYLLQRMELYRGLAILTTNLKSSVDTAFLRRFRFVVDFPFPNAPERRRIWERVFPPQTPTAGLDFDRLAQLAVSGGNIRNIALSAAFLAAGAGRPVTMKDLLVATRREYANLGKPLPEGEVKGWLPQGVLV